VHAVGGLVRELDRDLVEASCLESRLVLGLRERAGDVQFEITTSTDSESGTSSITPFRKIEF